MSVFIDIWICLSKEITALKLGHSACIGWEEHSAKGRRGPSPQICSKQSSFFKYLVWRRQKAVCFLHCWPFYLTGCDRCPPGLLIDQKVAKDGLLVGKALLPFPAHWVFKWPLPLKGWRVGKQSPEHLGLPVSDLYHLWLVQSLLNTCMKYGLWH